MASVTLNLYPKFREGTHDGNAINFETPGGNGVKCAIVTSAYSYSSAHDFWDDVSANEVSGTSYTTGGNVCSNGAVSESGGTVTVDLDDPAAWTQHASGFSNGRRAIFYHDTGTGATSRLIAYSDDFGADKGNVDGEFSVTIHATNGLFTNT